MIISFFAIGYKTAYGQFYNGSLLTFGKNRLQFHERFWSYLPFKQYDIYYYKEGKPLAEYTAIYASKQISEIEKKLDYTLENKIQFLVFNKLSDLKQSNIGLIQNDFYNTGGVTKVIGTKVFLFFEGSHLKLEEQIKYGITEIILNELLYGQSYFSMIKNSTLINFPDWYLIGLHNYIAKDWNTEINDRVKDGFLTGRYRKFNRLEGSDEIDAGHSLWKYIEMKYGASSIPNIIYMSKINKNIENGFLFVLGVSFKTLLNEWYDYYFNYKYYPEVSKTNPPANEFLIKKPRKSRVYQQLKLSNEGRYAAYTTNELGQYKIWIIDLFKKKPKPERIYKRENKLDEKADLSYPLLAWHPKGKILVFTLENAGKTWLYFYNIDERKFDKRAIYHFEKILDFSYNDKGDKLVVSAIQSGHSDIFVYDIASNSYEKITNDKYDDFNPSFVNNSKDIVFSSNRDNDTIKESVAPENTFANKDLDIFLYRYSSKSKLLYRITSTKDVNETQPQQYDKNHIAYLSDENGIINRFYAKMDSAVNYIDTAVHYRYFTKTSALSNNLYNIKEQSINPTLKKYAEIIRYNSTDKLYILDMAEKPVMENFYRPAKTEKAKTEKANTENKTQEIPLIKSEETQSDSGYIYIQHKNPPRHRGFTGVYFENKPAVKDSNKIDINDYKFSGKRQKEPVISDSIKKEEKVFLIPRPRNANVEYSINQLVSQLDFSYLNTSYQPFTGGTSPVYLNPGLAGFFQVGVTDLFEDYRITGGMRLSLDLLNNEFFLSYNNLKNRIDREIILHRLTFDNTNGFYIQRGHTNEMLYILKYPFNQVSGLKMTGTLRYDKFVVLAEDTASLKAPNENNYWAGVKAEYIFDNTREKGLNLYYGTRYKIFAEFLRQTNENDKNIFVIGFDLRHYIKISRTFIWANRLAYSSSFGKNKLIYYLGGVDMWLKPEFNDNIPVSFDQNYVYQTIATPMRGFDQNIRNGNSFALFNSELRFPVFKYFIKRPIKSEVVSNFQIVAFTDIGTAWTGLNPYSDNNSLYRQTFPKPFHQISPNPNEPPYLLVTIQNQNNPVVGGFGLGLRTKLFGYFIRGDFAWGVDSGEIQKMKFYLSLSLDF